MSTRTPETAPAVPTRQWPDVMSVPAGGTTSVRSAAAAWLFRRAVAGLDLRVRSADGAVAGGGGPDAPLLLLHRPQDFFRRLGATGLIGFGEAYLAGDWSTDDLPGVLAAFATRPGRLVPASLQRLRRLVLPTMPAAEENSTANTRRNIARHYDLSNELFALFLDETLTYSGADFGDLTSPPVWSDLAGAQRRKIDRLLDAAGVTAGTRLLEIGTGWGELALRAAARGATVRSVTLSSEQQALARQRIAEAGLADRVTIDLLDYRAVDGRYDAVVSVEMIEAVGAAYWPEYFGTIDRLLAPGGRATIQAITMPHDRLLASAPTYTWVHKYIFPGGQLTSLRGLREVTEAHTALRLSGDIALGDHYAHTLRLWRERFADRLTGVRALGFDETFIRMWQFYLAYSEAGFRTGYLDVHQLTFTRDNSLKEMG